MGILLRVFARCSHLVISGLQSRAALMQAEHAKGKAVANARLSLVVERGVSHNVGEGAGGLWSR